MRAKKLLIAILITITSLLNLTDTTAGTVPNECSIPFADRNDEDGNDYTICEQYYVSTDPSSGIEIYEGEFLTSEGTYHRIEYDPELDKWYGVVHVTDYEVVDTGMKQDTWINIAFSRELKELKQIVLEYTSEQECEHIGLFGICIGGMYESEVFHETINNEIEDGAWNENFLINNDNIIEYTSYQSGSLFNPGDYDYSVFLSEIELERQIETVRIISFDFELTDAEIIQLGLDIQDQYAYEVSIIANSNFLTFNDKELALADINDEYNQIPDLEFGMHFSQLCDPTDSSCYMVTPDVSGDEQTLSEALENSPSWLSPIIDNLYSFITLVFAGITAVTIAGIVAYMIIRKGLTEAGKVTMAGSKNFFKGCYQVSTKFYEGLNYILITPLVTGLKSYPKIIIGFIATMLLLFILL